MAVVGELEWRPGNKFVVEDNRHQIGVWTRRVLVSHQELLQIPVSILDSSGNCVGHTENKS